MALKNLRRNGAAVVDKRRQRVASLLIQRPGISQRQIVEALAGHGYINEATGNPWAIATINGDIAALRRDWQLRAARSVNEWIGDELAKLDALEAVAWSEKDLRTVLACMQRRAALRGLDAPKRLEIGWRGIAEQHGIDVTREFSELVEAMAGADLRRTGNTAA
ncbi:MAG: hypothetical protein KDE45_10960 [Caldilineaceae bacterium]|nr:hypothetical protein [Caldilineaceae bacterium]